GLTGAELRDVWRITMQGLGRGLIKLSDTGSIVRVPGPRDRRQRELYVTKQGKELALALALPQSRRIDAALREAGIKDRASLERFFRAMVNPERRRQLDQTETDANSAEGDPNDR